MFLYIIAIKESCNIGFLGGGQNLEQSNVERHILEF